jgi:transcriptional regulator with XRE-family HTH domain
MARTTKNAITKDVRAARRTLKRRGWTYQEAAGELGCSYGHLALVLTCRRESRRLLERIAEIRDRAA